MGSVGDTAKRWGAAIATATVGFFWSHAALPWILLIGLPVVTGWLAYLGDAGAYKVALAVQFAFAAMAVGLYHADLEMSRRRIKNVVQFSNVRFGRNINGPGIFLGIAFVNASEFPVEFEIKKLRTRISDKVPAKTTFDVKNVVMSPRAAGWFDDHVIQIDNPPKNGTLEGFIEFAIAYGRPGKLKYDLTQEKQVIVAFDGDGTLARGSWQEAKRE